MRRTSLALAVLLAATSASQGQQEVEWKQTLSVPKGAHMPRDRADILGIELGDTYAEVKEKLTKIWEEGVQPKTGRKYFDNHTLTEKTERAPIPVKEEKAIFRLDAPGSQMIATASYVKRLEMERHLQSSVPDRATHDKIQVYLSAPASGHQVIGINRTISYQNEQDQPRVSEILDQLGRKMKGQPHVRLVGSSGDYTFQFDQGDPVLQTTSGESICFPKHESGNAEDIQRTNPQGTCDAMLRLTVQFGLSRDHARHLTFILSDLERTKANRAADFAFVRSYVRSMQERTRGTAPKL